MASILSIFRNRSSSMIAVAVASGYRGSCWSRIYGWNSVRAFGQRVVVDQAGSNNHNRSALLRKAAKSLSEKEIEQLIKDIRKRRQRDTMYYVVGFSVFMLGGCWAAIPLYRIFCEDSNYGGFGKLKKDVDIIDHMDPVKDRMIRIKFNADQGASMHWKFKPLQDYIDVHPGETALAFFTATNPTDKPIIGVSTYNIVPYEAAAYFNKIQCFCFEEQLLNPGEQVDLPIFFYLDPDYAFHPIVGRIPEVILSYTFFQSKSNFTLKRPAGGTGDSSSMTYAAKLEEMAGNTANIPPQGSSGGKQVVTQSA